MNSRCHGNPIGGKPHVRFDQGEAFYTPLSTLLVLSEPMIAIGKRTKDKDIMTMLYKIIYRTIGGITSCIFLPRITPINADKSINIHVVYGKRNLLVGDNTTTCSAKRLETDVSSPSTVTVNGLYSLLPF